MQDTSTSKRTPPIRYRDPMGAIDWLCAAFRLEPRLIARRPDGSFAYAHLGLGQQQLTLAAREERAVGPAEPAEGASGCTLVVADLAAHFAHAKAAGVEIVQGLDGQSGGARGYACRDVEGHIWRIRAARAQRLAATLSWARTRFPRIERRAGLSIAAALTLTALVLPAWRLLSHGFAATPVTVAEGQAIEHARFALVEEQAARRAAESSKAAALDALAQERAARLKAEEDTRRYEAELAAARATQAQAEALVRDLDHGQGWGAQVSPATDSQASEPTLPASAEVSVVVAAVQKASVTPAPPANPRLAAGQAALARGDIAEARRLFRALVDEGIAEAALALGSTYDPVNAEQMTDAEVDRAQAKYWYRRAIELSQDTREGRRAP